MHTITINKEWAMPNSNTFSIKPINKLIHKYLDNLPKDAVIVDPFANSNTFGTITNDLDTQYHTTYHLEATDFLRQLPSNCADVILYDPVFSPRQLSECYKKFGLSVNMETTQASYWAEQKKQIARVCKEDGLVITCSWNSGGIGKKYGFDQIEILLVAHGGWHNDTITVVERKLF